MTFTTEQEKLQRARRRWRWMTYSSLTWLVIALALLPIGPDILIFVLSIAPTDQTTALTVAWVALIVVAGAATTIFAFQHRSASKRATAVAGRDEGNRSASMRAGDSSRASG
jgi:hypothetical protein